MLGNNGFDYAESSEAGRTEIQASNGIPEDGNSSQEPCEFLVIVTSSDLGDIPLYDFLRWHISVCAYCFLHENEAPPQFGYPDNRKCQDYYEIVGEYSEYEAIYIRRGEP